MTTTLTKPSMDRDGFSQHENVMTSGELEHLISLVERAPIRSGRGGLRDVTAVIPELLAVADSRAVRDLVEPILGSRAIVVRATLFDKTGTANWKVPWHQDVTIAVRERIDAEGYDVWSLKSGVLHVQPPASILEQMVSIRVHLDDCPESNGALRVISGSHTFGKIPETEIAEYVSKGEQHICAMAAGSALCMRPLLLHASSAATEPRHRRVLHFDYASAILPEGMTYAPENQAQRP